MEFQEVSPSKLATTPSHRCSLPDSSNWLVDKSRGNLHASQPRGKWWYATNSWWGTSRRPVDGSRSGLEKPAARRSSPCAAICGSEWNLGTTNIVLFGDGRNLVRGSEKKLLATIIWGLWNKSYRYAQANTNWGWTKPFLILPRTIPGAEVAEVCDLGRDDGQSA